MSTKHTPGPWVIETYHGSLFKICKPDFKIGDEVAHRLEADARLIAAAPELLGWLEAVVRQMEYQHSSGSIVSNDFTGLMGMVPQLKKVIAKATGGAK